MTKVGLKTQYQAKQNWIKIFNKLTFKWKQKTRSKPQKKDDQQNEVLFFLNKINVIVKHSESYNQEKIQTDTVLLSNCVRYGFKYILAMEDHFANMD